jgi:hypothetical protein
MPEHEAKAALGVFEREARTDRFGEPMAMERAPIEPAPAGSVRALIRAADACSASGRRWEAAELLEQALAIDPGSTEARDRLASLRVTQPRGAGDLEVARQIARESLAVHPDSFRYHGLAAAAAANLGIEDEFWRHFECAIARMPADNPNVIRLHLTAAATRLRRGDFTAFGDLVRWAARLPGRKGRLAVDSPEWHGGELSGRTILVAATRDGDGDTIMFCRYLHLLKAGGARVTVVCWERLASLLAGMGAVDRVIIPETPVPADAARHDFHVYWLPLPSLLGTTAETIPAEVPYLANDPRQVDRWRSPIATIPGLRVGITWQGDPQNNLDRLRSFPLAELAAPAGVPGVSLISLQKGPGSEQLADVGFPVWDLGPAYRAGDWVTTAAVMSHLDLIISPDTAVAHLAGALGRPAWLALHRAADWRWLEDRDDSPWYPTMRLFRQDRLGEWGPVFRRMTEALAARVGRDA